MVIDSIKNYTQYISLHKDFEKVFSFLTHLPQDVTGKTVLDEDNVWVNVFEVQEISEGHKAFEAHKRFIDIHYIHSGEVKFGYADVDHLQTKQPYNATDDYELLVGDANVVTLRAGDFMITFPEDAHIPDYERINDDKLVRIVAKVRI